MENLGGCRGPSSATLCPTVRFRTLAPRGSPRSSPSPAPQNPNHRAAVYQPRAESGSSNGRRANWRGGNRAGSKRPRIRARTCGELNSGASDREIRGGRGSVTGGELPLPPPARGPGSFRDWGLHTSRALSRRGLGGARARSLAPGSVCVGFWGLMARLFVKPPPRPRPRPYEEGGKERRRDAVYPSPGGGEVSFYQALYRPTVFQIAPLLRAVFAG
jgi:hypothetical protein